MIKKRFSGLVLIVAAFLLSLLFIPPPQEAFSTPTPTATTHGKNTNVSYRKYKAISITGFTAVNAATKGGVETVDLSAILTNRDPTARPGAFWIVHVNVSTESSTDYDFYIGNTNTIDVVDTTAYHDVVWSAIGVNKATYDNMYYYPAPLIADGSTVQAFMRLDNQDAGNATGAITVNLLVLEM